MVVIFIFPDSFLCPLYVAIKLTVVSHFLLLLFVLVITLFSLKSIINYYLYLYFLADIFYLYEKIIYFL